MRRVSAALVLVLGWALAGPASGREFVAKESDFHCLQDGMQPAGKHFFIFHKSKKKLRKAVRIAERDRPGKRYPVGTILQLFPFEAMVKRGGKFNRDGGGWEFFRLVASKDGTRIDTAPDGKEWRGGPEVVNFLSKTSCMDAACHNDPNVKAFDFVCEGHGGGSLNISDALLKALQTDPRCTGGQ